jgi:hypothetical protein
MPTTATTAPGSAEPPRRRPNPTRQRSFSNVDPSTNSSISSNNNLAPNSNSWFNTLAGGLSWIEVQSGNVVNQATQAGLGETIRGGLQGVGGVVQGGLANAKRPSLLNGVLSGITSGNGTPGGSENGDAMSDYSDHNPGNGSNHNRNNNNLLGSPGSTTSTPMRRRPASFLGLMKPRPQTPPAGTSPAQSPVQTPTNPSSRLFRNTTSPSPALGPGHGPSADPDPGSSGAPGTATPPRPPNFSSSFSSPPPSTTSAMVAPSSSATSNLGRPTVTRLGPPKPANMTRLRHAESAHPSQSRSTSQPSTPTPTSTSSQTQVTGLQGSPQLRNIQHHGRTSSTSDVGPANRTALNGGGLLRASNSGQSLDRFTLDGGNVNGNAGGVLNAGRRRTSGWELGMERRGSNSNTMTSNTPQPSSRAGTPGLYSNSNTTAGYATGAGQGSNAFFPGSGPPNNPASGQPNTGAGMTPPQALRTRSYKPGFQPPGVRSTRTQEFDEARRRVGEERGREEGRLGRRWAKVRRYDAEREGKQRERWLILSADGATAHQLIDLHFNPMAGSDGPTNASASTSAVPSTPPNTGKASSSRPRLTPQISERFNALTNTLDQVTPKDVWRGFRSVTGVGLEQVELEKKREVERGLVVWEEDGEVRRCRICQ